MSVSVPTRLCLACRTALRERACDSCPDGQVVSLTDPDGRAAAVAAAWREVELPPDDRPSVARRLALLGGVGGTLAATVGATTFTVTLGAAATLLTVMAGAGAAALLMISPMSRDKANEQPRPPKAPQTIKQAVGTSRRPALPLEPAPLRGTVTSRDGDEGDTTRWLELSLDDGTVTLRDGHTEGLAVELDDGRLVQIPPGRLRVDFEPQQLRMAPRNEVRARLGRIDRARATRSDDPFPYDRADLLRIHTGDRVEVSAELEERWEQAAGYREGSEAILHPLGLVWVRLLASGHA